MVDQSSMEAGGPVVDQSSMEAGGPVVDQSSICVSYILF